MINKPPPFKVLNNTSLIIIPIKGRGFINQGSTLNRAKYAELKLLALRVKVPNNHILTQNLHHNSYYPKPKYLAVGYLDPLGSMAV